MPSGRPAATRTRRDDGPTRLLLVGPDLRRRLSGLPDRRAALVVCLSAAERRQNVAHDASRGETIGCLPIGLFRSPGGAKEFAAPPGLGCGGGELKEDGPAWSRWLASIMHCRFNP